MKIGIIVHSHTGNTLSVAQKLKDMLILAGHSVDLEEVIAVNEDPNAGLSVELKTIPDTSMYDVLIFGAPIRALSLSPVMKRYLSGVEWLEGKKIGCFVTQFFPYEWMGGKNGISQMQELCKAKEGNVFATGIVNWSNSKRDMKINMVLEKLSNI